MIICLSEHIKQEQGLYLNQTDLKPESCDRSDGAVMSCESDEVRKMLQKCRNGVSLTFISC